MKKIVALVAAVVLVLGVFTGCSKMAESFQKGYEDAANGAGFNPPS